MRERAVFDDFFDFQSVSVKILIEEYTERSGLVSHSFAVTGSGVRAVQLAQHFRQHFGKVEIISDMRQVFLILGFVPSPVYAVYIFIVKLVVYLLPDVVENIVAFRLGTVVELGSVRNILDRIACRFYFFECSARQHIKIFTLFIGNELSPARSFYQQARTVFFQVAHP